MKESPLLYVAVAVLGAIGALIAELLFDDTINWATVLIFTPIFSVIGVAIGLRIRERRQSS